MEYEKEPEKKKPSDLAVAVLMKRMKKPEHMNDVEEEKEEGTPEENKGMSHEAEMKAFGKLREAIASEDDEKGAEALKQFLEACGAYEPDGE